MSELDYIGANELVFHSDENLGIGSGGFSVNSIMLKGGMSPIMTVNTEQTGGNFNKVSDLFNDLVVPNWALSYNTRIIGGKYNKDENNDDTDSDDVNQPMYLGPAALQKIDGSLVGGNGQRAQQHKTEDAQGNERSPDDISQHRIDIEALI